MFSLIGWGISGKGGTVADCCADTDSVIPAKIENIENRVISF
jgi:hypothetical protein